MLHKEITDKVLRAFYDVYNELGCGFLERVYQNSMMIELRKKGLEAEEERKVEVHYGENIVGTFFADITVDGKVILELKACEELRDQHKNQLINYLKASDLEIGLLLNFGPEPTFKRVIFSNRKSTPIISEAPTNPST